MKYDIILAGVGGQGVLSVSAIIASSAMKEGLLVKQSEVHGMSQRGGAVLANLRLRRRADRERPDPARRRRDDPEHGAAREPPLPALPLAGRRPRHVDATRSSTSPTTPTWTACSTGCARCPAPRLVDGEQLARAAGSARATNMVMVGAASHRAAGEGRRRSSTSSGRRSRAKGEKVVETNLKAFRAGRRGGRMTIDAAADPPRPRRGARPRRPPRNRRARPPRRRSASAPRRTSSSETAARPPQPTPRRSAATVSSSRSSRPTSCTRATSAA